MPPVGLLWKIHRVFFIIHIEGNISFIEIDNSTCGVKKRSTKNNGHAPILGHVKHNKISRIKQLANSTRTSSQIPIGAAVDLSAICREISVGISFSNKAFCKERKA